MTDTQPAVAWAAGIFEGEGSIEIRANRFSDGRYRQGVRLHMGMTDEDVVRRFSIVVGVGAVNVRRKQHHEWKTLYSWTTAAAADAESVLTAFLPWLGDRRRAKATEALDFLSKLDEYRHRVCYCGRPFYAKRASKTTCSIACYEAWRSAFKNEPELRRLGKGLRGPVGQPLAI